MEKRYRKEKKKRLLISIVGLTASGKTSFLHKVLDFLIEKGIPFKVISADSGAVYKYLDIGTAKPSKDEVKRYKYHLIDVVSPCHRYSLARFIEDANSVISNLSDGEILFIVGGTPLYFYTLVGESGYVPVKPDYHLREHLLTLADMYGKEYVYNLMKHLDPLSAEKIHHNDLKRMIRTIEINLATGKMRLFATSFYRKLHNFQEKRYVFLPPPDILRENIYSRTVQMFKDGFIEEAGRVSGRCPAPAPWLEVLGYNHAYSAYLGAISPEEAVENVFRDTWRFARRQRTWFKKDKKGVKVEDDRDRKRTYEEIIRYICSHY